jgi:hypothetical protein
LAVHAVAVRLRFVFVIGAAAFLAASWPSLRTGWDKLFAKAASSEQAVGLDSEFFCPMCPGVASDWPSKCPVCHMTLVRRSKGEAVVLPDGVVARMQLTPYRIQLAGVRSVVADYLPLEREMIVAGKVHGRDVEATIESGDELLFRSSTNVEAIADSLPGRPSVAGKIAKKSSRKVVVWRRS